MAAQPAANGETADGPAPGGMEEQAEKRDVTAGGIGRFLAGAAAGLALHEGGHLAFDYLFGASPGLRGVHFGPLPFYAITHRDLSRRREFAVSSAGFWVQELGSEVILTRRPRLRRESAPVAKGILAFNLIASIAYAGVSFAQAGPAERDTRSMAVFGRINEGAIGAVVLAPAVLDGVRYCRPAAAWATWASRAAKVGMVMLAAKKGR